MNIVIITSVLNPVNKGLIYTSTRSVFSEENRYKQTLKTIESIRSNIINSYIVLVECSDVKEEYELEIKNNVDKYINLYSDQNLKNIIESPHKGWGESIQILKGIEEIKNFTDIKNIYKISGRYTVNNKYDKNIDDIEKVVCKKVDNNNLWKWELPNTIVTVFFKIPKILLNEYYIFLITNQYMYSKGISAEHSIKVFLNNIKEKEYVNNIGFSGFISVDGTYYEG
jgi:hypothetical protein